MGPPEVDTPYYAFVPEKIHPSTRRESLHRAEKTITLLGDSFEGKQFENRTARQASRPGPYTPEDPNGAREGRAAEPLRAALAVWPHKRTDWSPSPILVSRNGSVS